MSKERREPCLFDQANLLSKITFWWLNPLFGKNPLIIARTSERYDVSVSEEADLLERRLDAWWKKELREFSEGGDANLKKAVLSTFLFQWILPGFILLLAETSRMCQPVILGMLLGHVSGETPLRSTSAYLHAFSLACMIFMHAALSLVYTFVAQRVALKMRAAVEALLYRKVMSLSSEAALLTSSTTVLDLFSTCSDVFTGALENIHYLWIGPLQLAVLAYLLHREMGTAGLLCLVVVLGLVLLHAVLEVVAVKLRERSWPWTEQRWQITGRILSVMTQIKLCCLESSIIRQITALRRQELGSLKGLAAVQAVLWWVLCCSSRLMLVVVVVVAVDSDAVLSVRAVLTSLVLLDMVTWCLYRCPVTALRDWLIMRSTLASIQTFLLLDEEKEQIKDLRLHRTVSYRNEPHADWVVDIDHMTARWRAVHTGERKRFKKRRVRDSTSSTKSLLHESDVEHAFSLKYLSLQVKKGELLAVVGPPLSGKSSLLMTLIGELPYEIGQIAVNGRVSFCAQQPWLFSGSVRDNIVFGGAFDSARYNAVIRAFSLSKLLEILPEGDETLVGERGLQLSNGHNARLTLARAAYHNADIYLLDDIFSFVDSETRQDIMTRCISGMLESKTRVIVTHNYQYLKAADRIAVLKEGSLFDIGSYEELVSRGINIKEFVTSEQSPSQQRDRLAAEEEDFQVRALLFAADWTLAKWIKPKTSHSLPDRSTLAPPQPSQAPDVTITGTVSWTREQFELYIIFTAVGLVAALLFSVTLVQALVAAARSCHDRMLKSLMRAKTGFFLFKSAESILSAFTYHLSIIDTHIPCLSYLNVNMLLQAFGLMIMMCAINPWLVIAVTPILVAMVTVQLLGARTLRGMHIFKDTAHKPVAADITETLEGLQTIRAFKRQDVFMEGFDSHLNHLTWSRFLALCVHSRLMLIFIVIVIVFLSVVIYVSVYAVGSIHGGLLGLCVTYCVTFLIPVQTLLQYSVCLGNKMVCVHQALSVRSVDQEPEWFSDKPPPDDWPNRGSITFSNTSLLAGPSGPYLLRDINVHIKSKEKVGVVGDTGSGKYSLVAALLRLGHVHGMIFMDGFDVLKIGLHELRKNVAVVPKDAPLFPGTLRSNLDSTEGVSDEDLWGLLDQVGLRDRVAGIRGGLLADVSLDSSLLSLGQRQLVYLARAMLRKTKVVVFDEPTENIEHGLNDQIQRILRAKFRECTVLTIAHRLPSVMDCDRIMVFHQGEVKEFDTPYSLMQIQGGYFMRLVDQCGKRQAQHLRGLAELAHQQRASASLMLEHAVFMATEQLHASMEDLSFRPGSLAWSNLAKFTKSQDSLEKAQSDWGSRGDVREEDTLPSPKPKAPSMAPAQKLINKRRMSPSRGKRPSHGEMESGDKEEKGTGAESVPLLSYDTPPKPTPSHATHRNSKENNRQEDRVSQPDNSSDTNHSSSLVDYKSSPRPRIRSSSSQNAPTAAGSSNHSRGGSDRKIMETPIDMPPAPRRNFSPFPADSVSAGDDAAPGRGKGRLEKSRGKTPPKVGYQPNRVQIISGEYSPPSHSKEDPEKIIYC